MAPRSRLRLRTADIECVYVIIYYYNNTYNIRVAHARVVNIISRWLGTIILSSVSNTALQKRRIDLQNIALTNKLIHTVFLSDWLSRPINVSVVVLHHCMGTQVKRFRGDQGRREEGGVESTRAPRARRLSLLRTIIL
jgi:hypothetical protein